MPYHFKVEQLRIAEVPHEGRTGAGYYVVEQGGIRHRLYEREYLVATLFDGTRSEQEVAELATERSGRETLAQDVERFGQQLLALGFAERV